MTKTDTKAKGVEKITLSRSRDIPFNQLVLSQSNVRRVKRGVSINELAADILRRTLLQSLTVRPVLDEHGVETGMFEIPAGGRRYQALELLVKQKLLVRNAPIPCVVRTEGIAEEDSLAENVQRAPLHPLDQFRAFQTLREKGQTEEEIAAVFFISVGVVKQRLRLASVSPKLLELYGEDEMTLDQLMGFTVNPDHERQEQVWEAIQRAYNKEPAQIRRLLTQDTVRASDKRARYVGAAYEAAGGLVMRDLFQSDDGGWLQDVGLLDRLVAEKLEREAETIRAEGWKWLEVAIDFPYGHSYGMRVISGQQRQLTEAEETTIAALQAEAAKIDEAHAEAEEYSDEADRRMGEIEDALATFENRPMVYDAADIARAGAFVSIDAFGELRVERGYVRHEDEPRMPDADVGADADNDSQSGDGIGERQAGGNMPGDFPDNSERSHSDGEGSGDRNGSGSSADDAAQEEDEGIRPLSDRLLTELTAYRTLALREAIGNDPDIAFLAALHVLCLKLFYPYGLDSCLEIGARAVMFGNQSPGLADTKLAADLDARHRHWAEQLPEESSELWDVLNALHADSRNALFAHCVSLTVNAVHDAFNRRPKAHAHARWLAETVSLDMAAAGWTPTVDSYLGRVTKTQILEAVREAKGEQAARRLETLKKGEMAVEAERLLLGSGWLPEPLRTRGVKPAWAELAEAIEPAEPAEAVNKTEAATVTLPTALTSENGAKAMPTIRTDAGPALTQSHEDGAKADSDPQAIAAE